MGTRTSTKNIASSTTGTHKIATGEHQHDPRLCATCCTTTAWAPGLRNQLELRAWAAGRRRIVDMVGVA